MREGKAKEEAARLREAVKRLKADVSSVSLRSGGTTPSPLGLPRAPSGYASIHGGGRRSGARLEDASPATLEPSPPADIRPYSHTVSRPPSGRKQSSAFSPPPPPRDSNPASSRTPRL